MAQIEVFDHSKQLKTQKSLIYYVYWQDSRFNGSFQQFSNFIEGQRSFWFYGRFSKKKI